MSALRWLLCKLGLHEWKCDYLNTTWVEDAFGLEHISIPEKCRYCGKEEVEIIW
jgi:hypothetical protein